MMRISGALMRSRMICPGLTIVPPMDPAGGDRLAVAQLLGEPLATWISCSDGKYRVQIPFRNPCDIGGTPATWAMRHWQPRELLRSAAGDSGRWFNSR